MRQLEVLYEAPGLPRVELPPELEEGYGGGIGFGRPRLIANFVSTLDGVVAIPHLPQSNKLIAGGSEADRFLMGLLRACADAVLVGSGTLRASPRGLWTPERAYPAAARAYAELRRRLDLPARPERVLLTGTGSVPVSHPVFTDGALVLTTDAGASRLAGSLPRASTLLSLGDSPTVYADAAVATLRERGHELILAEAGPQLFASLLRAELVDELFLTLSPLVAGRALARERRPGLVEGLEALPEMRIDGRPLSVRRAGAHLFLRYALGSDGQPVRAGQT